jgi:hypothetical protein
MRLLSLHSCRFLGVWRVVYFSSQYPLTVRSKSVGKKVHIIVFPFFFAYSAAVVCGMGADAITVTGNGGLQVQVLVPPLVGRAN